MSFRYLRWLGIALVALTLLTFTLVSAPSAHADGGAPNLAYIAGAGNGISIIDVGQQKVSGSIALNGQPHMILLSADARFLYATQPQQNLFTIYSAKAQNQFCSANVSGQPSLLALDTSTTNIIYVAGNGSSTVSAIDTETCTIKRTFQASGPVQGLAVAPVGTGSNGNGNQLWVSSGSTLTIFDTQSTHQIGNISISGTPQYLSIPPGATVYVTTKEGSVEAVDLSSHTVTQLITGGTYGPMDYNAVTGDIYVPDAKQKELAVLTPVTAEAPIPHEPARVFLLGVEPVSVAITNDGQLAFAALKGGSVAMLDVPGRQLINTFNVGGNPQFIITGQYPPALGTTPQQASTLGIVFNILAYILVIALFIVPIVLFRRYARASRAVEQAGSSDEENDIDSIKTGKKKD